MAPFFGVGVAVDDADNLYVADTQNDRALEYNGPFGRRQINNATADLVFEGDNLEQPSGVAADSNGNFYVSSESHNQVYEYTQPVPLDTADLLNLMIGPGAQNPNAASLQFPMGLAIDAVNNLYVADQANNRVLEFNEGSSPGHTVANGAGGQIDLSHNAPNYDDAIGEHPPGGIAVDASSDPPHRHLYVADTTNNRVLGWNDVSSYVSAQPANIAFGQPDLFSYKCNNGVAGGDLAGLGPDSLCGPSRMAVDQKGNLYVVDSGNNRVLVYDTPFNPASGEPGAGDGVADFVYGLGGAFTTRSCNLDGASATSLCNPMAVALDGAGNIYIADAGNNRVLEFAKAGNPPVASDALANRSYGQGAVSDFSSTQCADGVGQDPAPSNQGMCNPGGVTLDNSGNLFIADSSNNRVMEINAPLQGTQDAMRVFGQAGNFTASGCNQGAASPGASTLCAPAGLMIDVLGNLWVADVNNDRVLEYDAPFGSDTAATMVIGQGDGGNFTTAGCNRGIAPGDLNGLGADSLCSPAAVAVDSNIDLYVADTSNNRSLVFVGIIATPPATPTSTATATATTSPTATPAATATASATPTPSGTPTAPPTPSATPTPVDPKLTFSPKSLKFGKSTIVNSVSKPKTVTIKNGASKKSAVSVIVTGESAAAPFAVSSECVTSLAPGKSCKVSVTFNPTDTSAQSGELIINDDETGEPQQIPLSGTGKAPKVKK